MLLTPKSDPVLPIIYFNGNELKWVASIRYLGLQLGNKLKFNFHYNKVIQSLSKYVGIFYSISNYAPRSALISIFNSLVLPALYQNIIIWGYLPQYQINQINVKINRILRCILGVRFDDFFQPNIPTNDMYKMLNILKFKDLYNLSLLKFLHFILYKRPELFEFYFSHLLPDHSYSTRNIRIRLPITRLEIEKRSTVFRLCVLINEVHNKFILPKSMIILKKILKYHVLTSIYSYVMIFGFRC